MSILYSVISRGSNILARHANCSGNFNDVVDQVLAKVSPENAKMTYTHGSYLFHYISDHRIIYLCISEEDYDRSRAFLFLTDIKRRFEIQFGPRAQTALPFAMNSEFSHVLAARMRHHSNHHVTSAPDRVDAVQAQADELKDIMVRNIDHIAARGERLELLIDKTEDLRENTVLFRKSSRNLERSMCRKNAKLTVVLVVVVILVLYFIVCIACGGLAWPKCVKHK